MAEAISALVRTHFPEIDLILDEGWNSTTPDFRAKIRKHLAAELSNRGDFSEVTNLASRPISQLHAISISHCAAAGGFALCNQPAKLGLDLESATRDVAKALSRVSSADELSRAPLHAALWVAKEAVLKAYQLPLIADARIVSWKTLDDSSWFFSAEQSGHGFVHKNSCLIMGLFVFRS